MTLFQLTTRGAEQKWVRSLGAFAASAIAITALLAAVNISAQDPRNLRLDLVALFVGCALIFAASFRYAVHTSTFAVESALFQLRLRLCEKVRRADLYRLERLGLAAIYSRVLRDTTEISNSTWSLILGIHAALAIVFTLLYVGLLSSNILLIIGVVGLVAVSAVLRRRRQTVSLQLAVNRQQTSAFNVLTDLLKGHKEIAFRSERGDELVADFRALADSLKTKTLRIDTLHQGSYVLVNLAIVGVLAIQVFILPHQVSAKLAELSPITTSILFLLNPITHLLNAIPDYERASLAVQQLADLEEQLDAAAVPALTTSLDPWGGQFRSLCAQGLVFQYAGGGSETGFRVGPASFTIQAGEIIFFTGGNGGGKTTLLKLLSALYTPTRGALLVNDIPVTPNNVQSYREMIAAVFTDFHLFKKLYGLSGLSTVDVTRVLRELQLADRTSYSGERFSNLDLSTGQRKRLAMVVALLEDRPLYIFDEWAADQDPESRRYYYECLLPALRSRGKTVLAISHDDRYYHCADRVFTMDCGSVEHRAFPDSVANASPAHRPT